MIVVSDSSPLISLARANHTFLLPQLFGRVIVPEAVRAELENAPSGAPELDLQRETWLSIVALKDQAKAATFNDLLDPGEAEAIALALELKADWLLMDERKARAFAQKLGIRVIGVLGVLLEAKKRSVIEKIAPVLSELDSAGIWIADDLKNKALRSAGE